MSNREYNSTTHTYTEDGRVVPSVTQVIAAVLLTERERAMFQLPHVRDAAKRGTYAHQACQMYADGNLDEDELDEVLVPYVAGFKAFMRESQFKPMAWEQQVWGIGYAGTYDVLGRFGKELALVDIKTGTLPDWVGVQTAAYAQASGAKNAHRYCLQLPGDGNYRLHELKERGDWGVFAGALSVYGWMVKTGRTEK